MITIILKRFWKNFILLKTFVVHQTFAVNICNSDKEYYGKEYINLFVETLKK